jgi:hypothetical protein
VEDFEELKRAAMEEYGQSQRTFKYPLAGDGDEKVDHTVHSSCQLSLAAITSQMRTDAIKLKPFHNTIFGIASLVPMTGISDCLMCASTAAMYKSRVLSQKCLKLAFTAFCVGRGD